MKLQSRFAITVALSLISSACLAGSPAAEPVQPKFSAGDCLPALESVDEEGKPWKLWEHLNDKVLVLYFYPGDFTPGCIKQAQTFRDGLAKLDENGVQLVGISGDEAATHKLFKETYNLEHTLLADPQGELAKTLGVPVGCGAKVRVQGPDGKLLLVPMKRAGGILLGNGAMQSLVQRPVTLARWTFIIDRHGQVASVRQNVNPTTEANEVLEIVAALDQ